MPDARSPRLAVLIDADNTSATLADGLFAEIAKIGDASVRRIYGDFANPRLKSWSEILTKHALIPHQQFAYTTGKNASDIALVIDAMDLLHSDRFDGFCLVSSDSDFTRLAARIREDVRVYGFGKQTTPESFRQACNQFVFTENLRTREADAPLAPEPVKPSAPIGSIVAVLRQIIQATDDVEGWVNLGNVGSVLNRQMPDFDPRSYGSKKLIDLVRGLPDFEVKAEPGGAVRIRLKRKAAAKKAKKAG